MPTNSQLTGRHLPATLKLEFARVLDDEGNAHLGVMAVDADSPEFMVAAGSLRSIHKFLNDNGYEWATGSNALWRRA